jgi:tetratricopeptide (TPR) repeat protein
MRSAAGYNSEQCARFFRRLHELGAAAGDPEAQLVALHGLFRNWMGKAAYREADETVRRMREVPNVEDDPRRSLVVRVLSVSTLMVGAGSARAADAELSALGPLHGLAYGAGSFKLTPAFAKFLLGLPVQALRLSDEAVAYAREEDDEREILVLLKHKSALHFFLGDMEGLERNERAALDIVESARSSARVVDESFGEFDVSGRIMLQWVRCVRHGEDPRQGALTILRYDRESTAYYHGFNLSLAAVLWLIAGDRDRATNDLDRAIKHQETIGEWFALAELWRLRALLAGDAGERTHYLEHSLSLSRKQHATWWELQATADLVEATSHSRAARERLRDVYARFTEGFDLPALQRARQLLGDDLLSSAPQQSLASPWFGPARMAQDE